DRRRYRNAAVRCRHGGAVDSLDVDIRRVARDDRAAGRDVGRDRVLQIVDGDGARQGPAERGIAETDADRDAAGKTDGGDFRGRFRGNLYVAIRGDLGTGD